MGRGRATYGNPRTPTSHGKSYLKKYESCKQHVLTLTVYAVQARFVLPPPCVTPQGMSTRAHEVYYLREVLRLTYAEISMRLGMATSGTITRLCRRAAAFLEAQEEVLEAGAYQALLAGVRGEVRQPGKTLEKVQESPPRRRANSVHFQRRQQQQRQQQDPQHQGQRWQQQHQEPLKSCD